MPAKTAPEETLVDALLLAEKCRALSLQRFPSRSSCIETTQIFERAAAHLGLAATRVVCQAYAHSPKLAAQMKTDTVDKSAIGQPGIWAVGVGVLQYPDDYVGRLDAANNRFVGHVVCLVDDYLIDPTVDQMSRPAWDMPLPYAVLCPMDEPMKANNVAWMETDHGVLLKYVIHPDVKAPPAKSGKIIERLAIGLAREFGR